jgi:hypothetical protein
MTRVTKERPPVSSRSIHVDKKLDEALNRKKWRRRHIISLIYNDYQYFELAAFAERTSSKINK